MLVYQRVLQYQQNMIVFQSHPQIWINLAILWAFATSDPFLVLAVLVLAHRGPCPIGIIVELKSSSCSSAKQPMAFQHLAPGVESTSSLTSIRI